MSSDLIESQPDNTHYIERHYQVRHNKSQIYQLIIFCSKYYVKSFISNRKCRTICKNINFHRESDLHKKMT